jgi:AraC family transcriptional regulator
VEINRRKLERARRLLREGRETVTTIAQDCGFTDAAHFSHVFVRKTGRTPGNYRKETGKT